MCSFKFNRIISLLIGVLLVACLVFWVTSKQNHELISLFPIENYDQTISHWIKSSDKDYDQPLLTSAQQKMRKDELYAKYFGARSPWSAAYINKIFAELAPHDLQSVEQAKINFFDNKDKPEKEIQYGSNFIPRTQEWIQQIIHNMNLQQFSGRQYEATRRGIALDNLQGRYLPTNDVSFYSHKLAGEGYPFDNLQAAMIWAGTPIYILGETRDRSWSLVHTPNFIAWVKSNGIAIVDDKFVNNWKEQAQKNLAAITHTKISIIDLESNSYRFTGYIGMLFPAMSDKSGIRIMIPVANANRHAEVSHAQLSHQNAVLIPLLPTPHHFAGIMQQLINRPYGWGGMYHNNDCSSELKNLFIPFGILLPNHSTNQVDPESFIVKQVDLSKLSMDERLAYLSEHGHKFMTTVYIGGHVLLYVGNYENPKNSKEKVILTYQEMWGLRPKNADANSDSRAVIGKSVLFPLLKVYPENPRLNSPANKGYFQLGFLDPMPDEIKQPTKIDLEKAVSP